MDIPHCGTHSFPFPSPKFVRQFHAMGRWELAGTITAVMILISLLAGLRLLAIIRRMESESCDSSGQSSGTSRSSSKPGSMSSHREETCLICLEAVAPDATCWELRCMCAPVHAECLQEWFDNSVHSRPFHEQRRGVLRVPCPKCGREQSITRTGGSRRPPSTREI